MPAKPRKSNALSEEFAALAAETGMTLKAAKVAAARDKFVVKIGATQKPIPVGEINSAADIKKLVGKDVVVAVSGSTIVGIGGKFPGCYWIICYIPVPDLFKRIGPEIRQVLVQKYVDQKVITPEFGKQIQQQMGMK